jgi:glycine/D-amino acid oxidase-like deaminating enzyme
VIGGGFYGCALALHLKKRCARVTIIESRSGILQRASYVNQGRVHGGYHYPRHKLTAQRCRDSYAQFVHDYADCVNVGQESYYAIAAEGSRTSASQFWDFCHDIGAPLYPVAPDVRKAFRNIDDVFRVDEASFDADRLRVRLEADVRQAGIELVLNQSVTCIREAAGGVQVQADTTRTADHVFSCVYSHTNELLARSGLPSVPLVHEWTEMPLVMPWVIDGCVAVMDGDFCALATWGPSHCHCLHDVAITPRSRSHRLDLLERGAGSNAGLMCERAARFFNVIPTGKSLWEIKTILQANEEDDGRPILVQRNVLPGFHVVVGAKLDNIYDAKDEADAILDNRPSVGQKLRNVVSA